MTAGTRGGWKWEATKLPEFWREVPGIGARGGIIFSGFCKEVLWSWERGVTEEGMNGRGAVGFIRKLLVGIIP
jgi:hypothetical protein